MAISFNTSWTHGTDSSVTDAATIPAGVLAGDVMVVGVTVFCETASGVTAALSGGSAGAWTQVSMTSGVNPEVSTAGATIWSYGFLFTKTAAAGDPGATLTATASGSGGAGVTWMNQVGAAYTGAKTAAPADVCFGGNAQGTQTATAPSGTTATANDWAVYVQLGGNGQNPTYSTGTLRSAQNTAANVSNALYDSNGAVASGTSIGGGTWTGQVGGNNWFSMFTLGLAPAASAAAPLPLAIPGQTWRRRFKHRQAYPYPLAAITVSLADSGTGTDTFSAGNVSTPLPAIAGKTWLEQFKHRQQPLYTSTFSKDFADSGAGADTLAISSAVPLADSGTGTDAFAPGILNPPLPAVFGRTWQRQFKHRQAPLYTSTFSQDLSDSGAGTDTLGIASSVPLADAGAGADTLAPGILNPPLPAAFGRTWLRNFKHRQAYPYIPLQVNVSSIGLTDSGTGADAFSAAIINPPLPAVPGRTWQRQYKHRQQPLYTSTFSEDFTDSGAGTDTLGIASTVPLADAGTGTDTLTPGPVFSNPLFPATPGSTWKRQFKHAQTYPYLPLQPGQVATSLADSGSGADTFAAGITTTLPLTLRVGKTWLRQYKHRQVPLYTSVFSEDLADSGAGADALTVTSAVPFTDTGAGTDTLALSVVTANPVPLPAIPGRTWARQFKHRQVLLYASTAGPAQKVLISAGDLFTAWDTGDPFAGWHAGDLFAQ